MINDLTDIHALIEEFDEYFFYSDMEKVIEPEFYTFFARVYPSLSNFFNQVGLTSHHNALTALMNRVTEGADYETILSSLRAFTRLLKDAFMSEFEYSRFEIRIALFGDLRGYFYSRNPKNSEADEYFTVKIGDDPIDLYQIKEYVSNIRRALEKKSYWMAQQFKPVSYQFEKWLRASLIYMIDVQSKLALYRLESEVNDGTTPSINPESN